MSKIYRIDNLLVGTSDLPTSDHKILVDADDNTADFLFEKQAPTSQIGFVEDPDEPGKFLVLLDKNRPDATDPEGTGLLRTISTFSTQNIDSTYVNISEDMSSGIYGIVMPITISIGKIKGFALYSVNQYDLIYVDRIQLIIASNTENKLANSKVEVLAQWGFNNELDNVDRGTDYKSYTINDNTAFNSIDDTSANYHFLLVLLHIDKNVESAASRGFLAKSRTGSPLIQNTALQAGICGSFKMINDAANVGMIDGNFIAKDGDTYKVSSVELTNLNRDFPYIEFYQERGV